MTNTVAFIYMWNLKNKINEQTKQKQTHRYRGQTDVCQRVGSWQVGMKEVKGLSTNWQLEIATEM